MPRLCEERDGQKGVIGCSTRGVALTLSLPFLTYNLQYAAILHCPSFLLPAVLTLCSDDRVLLKRKLDWDDA